MIIIQWAKNGDPQMALKKKQTNKQEVPILNVCGQNKINIVWLNS